MSAMWSASSSTATSIEASVQLRRSIRSSSRPGVATTMSTPRSRVAIWRPSGAPPNTATVLTPSAWPSGSSASRTCTASSRVGTSTRPRGVRGAGLRPASRVIIGRPKARVLPEPVWARPSTSRPARQSASVAAWIGNAVRMSRRSRAVTSSCGRPSLPNEVSVGSGLSTAARSNQAVSSRSAAWSATRVATLADGLPAGRRRWAPPRSGRGPPDLGAELRVGRPRPEACMVIRGDSDAVLRPHREGCTASQAGREHVSRDDHADSSPAGVVARCHRRQRPAYQRAVRRPVSQRVSLVTAQVRLGPAVRGRTAP